ncbi:MAG: glucosidase, partial [Candidatus Sericytochromatia bacterium]|nr:glucosidase [Candidatus Sericytochromatia bacterium]
MNTEQQRLSDHATWMRWGPYLAERAWGTVREDYSADGDAWRHFPHDQARSRAYRWNEDGLAGLCDREQMLCLGLTLWNGQDPILKERLFGLAGPEGNHGEDVKEVYHYLDAVPSHAWLHMRYRYPQAAFPYEQLVAENARRGRHQPEFDLLDTGVFDQNRYFDVDVHHLKAGPEDLVMRITATNRGPEAAPLHLLPTLWFRNTWSWDAGDRPEIRLDEEGFDLGACIVQHPTLGQRWFYAEGCPALLFTENDTNTARLYGSPPATPYTKDAFHRYLIGSETQAINPQRVGTKVAAHQWRTLAPGETWVLHVRLSPTPLDDPFGDVETLMARRAQEADQFWAEVLPDGLSADGRLVARQALAGMVWTKQFYHYDVQAWLRGDPAMPPPPQGRARLRNGAWQHMRHADVLSMPDAWEYPWYAGWDLAFHCLPLALIDPEFAKQQLRLLVSDAYQGPDGQVPAYEWNFSDTNPPVLAMASLAVYQLEARTSGRRDRDFLRGMFHKLLLQFTWWVNRKDAQGNHLYEGGFLGLDNIGVFDRSRELPTGGHIEQADGSAWMAMFALDMVALALELAQEDPIYADMASRCLEHFARIALAMSEHGEDGVSLWDEVDGFYYDVLTLPDGRHQPLHVRSMVGLVPLFAVLNIPAQTWQQLPAFTRAVEDLRKARPAFAAWLPTPGSEGLVSLVPPERLRRVLARVLAEEEFLSPFGVRSLSRHHAANPYRLSLPGGLHEVAYEPAESSSGMFGGNSNWRGPVWFPMNEMLVQSLQRFHAHLGAGFQVEFPTGSGRRHTLGEVADGLCQRLGGLFLCDQTGRRPCFGDSARHRDDPAWRDALLFHEYFHGDTGEGLGAAHQTGWTGLVANMLLRSATR